MVRVLFSEDVRGLFGLDVCDPHAMSRRRSKSFTDTWVTAKSCAVTLCSHRLAEQSCVSASKKQHLAHLLWSVRIPLRRRRGQAPDWGFPGLELELEEGGGGGLQLVAQ